MPNYVSDLSKKSISYVIKGVELFRFTLINSDTVEILCECDNSFQTKINNKHLKRCDKCGCLWHIEEDHDKITLIQPSTNFGLTFAKTKGFLDEVYAATIKADEENRQRRIDLNKSSKLDNVLDFIKKSGIGREEIVKALRKTT